MFQDLWLNEQFITSLYQNFIIHILVGGVGLIISRKYIRKIMTYLWKKLYSLFCLRPFPDRDAYFIYQHVNEPTPFKNNYRDHLCNRSLLGDIKPPSIYGYYAKIGGQRIIEPKAKRLGKEYKKIKRFAEKCVLPFRFIIKSRYIKEGGEWIDTVDVEFIFRSLFIKIAKDNEPQLVALRGKVGCGKSTFLIKLCSLFIADNKGTSLNTAFAPVLVDVRKILIKTLRFESDFHKNISDPYFDDKVIASITKEVANQFVEMGIEGISETDSLNSIIENCYQKNISPIIVLDELDYLYTDFSRRIIASSSGPDNKCLKIYNEIFKKLCHLHHSLPICGTLYNANSTVILSARTSTEKLINEIISENSFDDIHHVKIDEPGSDVVRNIISKQLEIIKENFSGSSRNILEGLIYRLECNIKGSASLILNINRSDSICFI